LACVKHSNICHLKFQHKAVKHYIKYNIQNAIKISTIQWDFIYAQQSKQNIYKNPTKLNVSVDRTAAWICSQFCRNTKMWSHNTLNATRTWIKGDKVIRCIRKWRKLHKKEVHSYFGYYNQEVETNSTFSDIGGNEKGLNILRRTLCGYHIAYGREIYSAINRFGALN
jgi:hypothetical protein